VGESITEVTIAQWLKKDGDYVEKDELICEIESDKASFEIPAEASGVLKTLVAEGETVEVGAKIAEIDSDAQADAATSDSSKEQATSPKEEAASPKTEPKTSSASQTAPTQHSAETHKVVVPSVGESITEVTIAQWLVDDGAEVKEGDLICEIESDKASFEIPAEASGVVKHLVKAGDVVEVGSPIAEITGGATSSAKPETPAEQPAATHSGNGSAAASKIKVSPVAANMISEAGLSPEEITGTGPGGKITKEDVQKALSAKQSGKAAEPAKKEAAEKTTATQQLDSDSAASTSGKRNVRRERMSTLRKTISKRLVAAKNETAMLTTFNEVDMGAIMEVRKKYKEIFKEKHEVGLGFMSFFTKAVCLAMRDWPSVNAMIDGDQIVYHDYVDVSIAVSTPRGLVVPVIRNAESLTLAEIEKEVIRLATRARDNKLTIEEMTGGTFTITNGGVFGSLMSTPIINIPQSAILGMHKIQERPMVIDGQIVIRPMMYLALSYDHRIIDGRESVSFLVRVKELLEDPTRMLLEV
jgi:2-oxoglutarate dehydrogenase E2 component (dihydrolipoamide succinyltransferase)